MKYFPAGLKDEIKIKDIVTVHYFEYSKNYKFPGESHNFWEAVYVDRGQVIEKVENGEITTVNDGITVAKKMREERTSEIHR